MAIAITIEDGTGVVGANSYETIIGVRAYTTNRGIVLGTDDEVAAMLIKSFDYLETKDCEFQGERTDPLQESAWPRIGVILNSVEIGSNAIPRLLKSAQSQAVMALAGGLELLPNVSPQDYIIRDKTGPLETEYASPLSVGIMPMLSAVDAMLAPLFGKCASVGFSLRTIRV